MTCPAPVTPTVALAASPNPVSSAGGQSTLSWSSTNAYSCVAQSPWPGAIRYQCYWWGCYPVNYINLPTSGTQPVSVTSNTTYSLTCTGAGGTSPAASVTVSVADPCPATTINNCNLPTTSSGSSAGSCPASYTGSCSYSCNNRSWTSPSSNSCTAPAAPCNVSPWGTIASGSSVTAYQSASVTSPATCTSQTRTCTNGTLSGSYTNASCSVTLASCTLPWGGTIASGVSVTAFLNPTAVAPATCASDPSQTRTCTNGTLSGSYTNQNCTALNPAVTMAAAPSRVQPGNSTKLSWSTTDVTSCTVKGTNGFSHTGTSGTNVDSGAITSQTTFTLACNAGSPKSVVVNVVPAFQEF
ncbi:MAG: hypothetical protein ACYC48_01235 [Minisyncoccota bacterium]